MSLMKQVSLPEGQDGPWAVKKFTVNKGESEMSFLTGRGRGVPPGTYTELRRGGALVMSDTPDEMRDHYGFVRAAKGRVLIAGLGLGMVLQAVLDKPEVAHATVIEKAPEVIRLVGPTYKKRYGNKLEIVAADIFEWAPPKAVRYDAAWFDVWDDLCSDNLEGMTKLKRRFGRRATWKGCWGEYQCRRHARHDRQFDRVYRMTSR